MTPPYKDPERYAAYQAAYHQAPVNQEKARQRMAASYAADPKPHNARAKKYRESHPERVREACRRWLDANPKKKMLTRARMRSKRDGLLFNLSPDDFEIPEVCPILGIPLRFATGRGPSDHSPSIDRIDNNKGYVKGNIIVVSWRANRIKGDATPDELALLAAFYSAIARPFS